MLVDAAGIRRVVLACGTVDLRKGIDGLATIIGDKYGQNPFEKGTLFLFCGKRSDRCKGLLWMGTGFLLLYKRFEDGRLSWPRTTQEAADLTEEQYRCLMMGLNPLNPKIKDVDPKKYTELFVQNREIYLLFFHIYFYPWRAWFHAVWGYRNGIYAFQNTKTDLENSVFPSSVTA